MSYRGKSLLFTAVLIAANSLPSAQAAFILDTFIGGNSNVILTPGETSESTGLVSFSGISIGNQRQLDVQATVPLPAGQGAGSEVVGGSLKITHTASAPASLFSMSLYRTDWSTTPFDLTVGLGSSNPTNYSFDVDFLVVQQKVSPQTFVLKVLTQGGGIIEYAGLVSGNGPQTMTMTQLVISGTPDPTKVLAFEFQANILAGDGSGLTSYDIGEIRAIPEPSVATLAIIAGALAFRRRRNVSL
jgi:hypothetical protein